MVDCKVKQSEIVILIDINSLYDSKSTDLLLDNIKEAVSLQITRGVTTRSKLYKLGFEPNLARVSWTYVFFDSTVDNQQNDTITAQPLKTLSFDIWDLFEEELSKQVKSYTALETKISSHRQMQNIVNAIHIHKSLFKVEDNSLATNSLSKCNPIYQSLFVFTKLPVAFASLITLAVGIDDMKHSSTNLANDDLEISFIDVIKNQLAEGSIVTNRNVCFWDELLHLASSQSNILNPNLKISCLKKLLKVHKLWEMIPPAIFSCEGTIVSFGIGMKRLKHLEWVHSRAHLSQPQRSPNDNRETGCLPMKDCWNNSSICQ